MTTRKIIQRQVRLICPACGRIRNVNEEDFQRYPKRYCGDCLINETEIAEFEPYDPDKHRPPWDASKRRRA